MFKHISNKGDLVMGTVPDIFTGLFAFVVGLIAWVYNKQLKTTEKGIDEIWNKVAELDNENKKIKNNYINRFEILHNSQHESEIAILEGLSKLSYDVITKIEQNNKELKIEMSRSVDQRIEGAINNCKLREIRSNNV